MKMTWTLRDMLFIAIFGLPLTFIQVQCLEPPEQIHISYGESAEEIVIMWSTADYVTSAVHYGEDVQLLQETQKSQFEYFYWSGKQHIHRAVLKGLKTNTRYHYQVICSYKEETSRSPIYSFKTMDTNYDRSASFLVYGDLGVNAPDTFKKLAEEVATGQYESIWHVGDFAYDMHSNGGLVGDEFMRRLEKVAANIPYMTAPGNHEIEVARDFAQYRFRFSTPGTEWPIPQDKMWYSYNVGPVHFISYSTEVYFTNNQNDVCTQFNWLKNDLELANQNRDSQPWIIALGHRPMYCSNSDIDDCTDAKVSGWVRRGLEDLFHAEGVDFVIEAHEHSYERLYPMYHNQLVSKDYTDPNVSVHVISGAAGNTEGVDGMRNAARPWSAYRHSLQGDNTYGRLVVHNTTHLYWDQKRVANGDIIDSLWLVQNDHGPFVRNFTCSGLHKHSSCICPEPFHYLYYVVPGLIAFVLIVLCAVIFCCRRCIKRKRLNDYRKLNVSKGPEETETEDEENLIV